MAIHVLDKHTAELIAAGEVVERPASVVKELCENAIDAGAKHVTVEIERGGVGLVRVSDDGSGVEQADIPKAFLRHATSKVRFKEDLDAIHTLGFRGEALASIASVARVELLTRTAQDEAASLHRIEGGVAGGTEPAARGVGTTLAVRELFYNTPARMKFLKKDASEGTFVAETVARLALSHPEVGFRFVREGKPAFTTPGDGDLRGAVYTVLGAAFARDMVAVAGDTDGVEVSGLITPPRAGRASRSMQYFYLNGRFVKNGTIMAALEQAYRGMAMQGRFPGGVLFVSLPAGLVDVNVHPAKTEVRFANEQAVFGAVYRAVKAALLEGDAGHSQFTFTGEKAGGDDAPQPDAPATSTPAPQAAGTAGGQPIAPGKAAVDAWNGAVRSAADTARMLASDDAAVAYRTHDGPRPYLGVVGGGAARSERALDINPDGDEPDAGVAAAAVPAGQDAAPRQQRLVPAAEGPPLRLVGELFKTYILAEAGDTLCLIDKHAAHERLLYERINAARGKEASQQLLAPVPVALGAGEKNALLQNEQVLLDAGIQLEDFGGGMVLVRGVPADVYHADIEGLVTEVAARLSVNAKDSLNEKTEWVLHSMACRVAVKAGDKSAPGELLRLAQDILDGSVPPFCPHGRPVVLSISRKELERQFGRLG